MLTNVSASYFQHRTSMVSFQLSHELKRHGVSFSRGLAAMDSDLGSGSVGAGWNASEVPTRCVSETLLTSRRVYFDETLQRRGL